MPKVPSIGSYTNNSSQKKTNSIQKNQNDSSKTNNTSMTKNNIINNNSMKNNKKRKELIDQYSNSMKNKIKSTFSQTKVSTTTADKTSNLKQASTNSYLYNMKNDYRNINNNNNVSKNTTNILKSTGSQKQDLINKLKNKSSALKFSITSKNYYINIKNNKNNNVNSFQLEEEPNDKNNKNNINQDITKGINILSKFDTFVHEAKYQLKDKNKFNKTTFNYYFDKSNNLKNTKSFDINFNKLEDKNKLKSKKHIIIDTDKNKNINKQNIICVNKKDNNNNQENDKNKMNINKNDKSNIIIEEKIDVINNKDDNINNVNNNIDEIKLKNKNEKIINDKEKNIEIAIKENINIKEDILKKDEIVQKNNVLKYNNLNKNDIKKENNIQKDKNSKKEEKEKEEKNKDKSKVIDEDIIINESHKEEEIVKEKSSQKEIKDLKHKDNIKEKENEEKEIKEKEKENEEKNNKEKEIKENKEKIKEKKEIETQKHGGEEKKEKKEKDENKENIDKNEENKKKSKEEIKYDSPIKKSKSKKKKKNSKNQTDITTPIIIQCKPLSPTHNQTPSKTDREEDLIPEYFSTSSITDVQIPKDYLNIIYYNLLIEEKENRKYFKAEYNYMNNQTEINDQMRSILIDWIIDVHGKFGFCDETLYMTVSIIDRYSSIKKITRNEYQCLGITALMIACKHEEINVPKVEDFIYITDNAYNKEEVFNMEIDILDKLNYNLLYPSPIKFFEYLSLHFNFDKKMHFLGKYLMETFLLDLICIKFRPSIISCACTYIVMKFFKMQNYKESYAKKWYMIEGKEGFEVENGCGVKDCATELCNFVDNINNTNYLSCQKKYSADEYCNISKLIINYPDNNNKNKTEGK